MTIIIIINGKYNYASICKLIQVNAGHFTGTTSHPVSVVTFRERIQKMRKSVNDVGQTMYII